MQTQFYTGIEHTLRQLKALGLTTGIVTSKTDIEFRNDLIPFGLMAYFDRYVSPSDTQRHKPFPDPLLKFFEISGLKADHTITLATPFTTNKRPAQPAFRLAWPYGEPSARRRLMPILN